MSGLINSMNGTSSSLQDGRVLTSSYTPQSGSSSGLQGMHGSYIPNTYSSRSSTMLSGPTNNMQQIGGNVSNNRFTINNLPSALSQLSLANSHNGGAGLSQNVGSGGNIGRVGPTGGSNIPGVNSRLNLNGPQMVSMMGNTYTASAAALQNQLQGRNSHLPTLALLNEMENNAFDMGEFPQLSGRPNSSGASQGQFGFMRKQSVGFNQQNQEFSIQNEDFPALPGFRGGNSEFGGSSMHGKEQLHDNMNNMMKSQQLSIGRSGGFNFGGSSSSHNQQHQQQQHPSSGGGGGGVSELSFQPTSYQDLLFHGPEGRNTGISVPGAGPSNLTNTVTGTGQSFDQTMQQYQQLQKHPQFRMNNNNTPDPTSQQPSNPSGPTPDRFGMMGLLNVIKMTNPALTSLALGIDLTTLGLNLNSSENLHKKFASPWSDEPVKGEPEFVIPSCYTAQQPPPLKQSHFVRLRLETLFYIFYSMPKDEIQLFAANELHVRGWFYHKDLHLWLTRVPNMEPLVKTNTYERGCYVSFDPNLWTTTRKDNFVLQYEMIEKRPVLPQQSVAS